jgi:formate--tetrahydrofolate ligase
MVEDFCKNLGASFARNQGFAKGGDGAIELAKKVVEVVENNPSKPIQHTYELNQSVQEKLTQIVQKVYGGAKVVLGEKAQSSLKQIKELGADQWPVCIAKTQYSFSTDAKALGAPTGHTLHIREVRLAAGAEFVVMVCGDVMTMPGLPKVPSAHAIDIDDAGHIVGLF